MDRVKIVDGGMENGNQRLANNDIVIIAVIVRDAAARPDFYLCFRRIFFFQPSSRAPITTIGFAGV